MSTSSRSISWQSAVKTIAASGLIAGALDIVAAIVVYAVVLKKTSPIVIVQYIASGILGKDAFYGGMVTALYGLALHFFIAFAFATAYFFIFRYLSFLRKHKIVSGIVYGIFIWVIMNLLVIPAVFDKHAPITLIGSLIGMGILVLMVGLPISLVTHRYYASLRQVP